MIQLVEVDCDAKPGQMRAAAPKSYWEAARKLVEAVNEQGRQAAPLGVWQIVRQAANALNSVMGGHFRDEALELAERIDCEPRDIIIANLSYDLGQVGCTTFGLQTADGPLHARNLDWSFPGKLLRQHVAVERVLNAPSGEYLLVTWPGLFGALTGLAPGRFSVTVNYVVHDEESTPTGLMGRAFKGHWPSTWVVRTALNEKANFASAVKYLSEVPLLSPVLFTVVGTKEDERAVIERSATSSVVRRGETGGLLCVTNHYVSKGLGRHNVDLEDGDTRERLNALSEKLSTTPPTNRTEALAILSSNDLFDKNETQHQVAMCARTGKMTVQVPGKKQPVEFQCG